jgi:putative FmdB family regulatory protein
MPIYEYECRACGRTHETIQKLNDSPLKKCPVCGSKKIEKLISTSAIIVRESPPRPSEQSDGVGGGRFNVHLDMHPDFRHPRVGSRPAFGRDSGPFAIDATTTPDFKHPRIGFRRVRKEGE